MAHPLHGTNPLAEKTGRRCSWGAASGLYFYKLERPASAGVLRREVHPSARFVGRAEMDEQGRPRLGNEARSWAAGFPGWELAFA